MSIKDLLLEAGLNEDQVSNITKQIGKEFVTKEQYNKISGSKSEVENKITELEAELSNKSSELSKIQNIKSDYDSLVTEYNNYKADIETKASNQTKSSKLQELFKNEGYNEKIIKHMIKDIDLSKLELNDDGINYPEEQLNAIRSEYEGFKTVTETEGVEPSKPIASKPTNFTKEQIKNMTPEQINANWDNISQNMANIK